MKSIKLASIVFTLSFCLNLVAEKNLPYKGSPSAGTKPHLVEVEDTEDNNGERGTYMLQTKSDLSVGGSIHNGNGSKVDIGADYQDYERAMPILECVRRYKKCKSKCRTNVLKGRKKCRKCRSKIQKCERLCLLKYGHWC